MMKSGKNYSVDKYLKEAYKKNIVLSGLSAGSLCWFKAGFSDSEFIEGIDRPRYKWVKGLGILPYLNNVHYEEEERKEFDEIMKKESTDAIALESNVAFVEMDGKTFYIRADKKEMHIVFYVRERIWKTYDKRRGVFRYLNLHNASI